MSPNFESPFLRKVVSLLKLEFLKHLMSVDYDIKAGNIDQFIFCERVSNKNVIQLIKKSLNTALHIDRIKMMKKDNSD